MKVLIVTQRAPIYLGYFLHQLLQDLSQTEDVEVQGVVAFSPIFKKTKFEEIRARLNLYGTWDFLKLATTMVAGKFLSPLFPHHPTFSRIGPVLQEHELPLYQHDSPTEPQFLERLKDTDLMVSIACPKILKREVYELPSKGSINYHTGALPNYRGRQPLYWAMLNGEKEIGITVHRMAEEVDAGPILSQKMADIDGLRSLHQVYLRTLPIGASALSSTIIEIQKGTETVQNNDIEGHRPNPFPGKAEGLQFRQKGLSII